MFETIRTLVIVGGALAALFLYLLSAPHSRLREVLMPVVGWGFALFCGGYMLMPIDLLPEAFLGPFGLIDDAGAALAGVLAARSAINARSPARG